jgi:hypothetical protein
MMQLNFEPIDKVFDEIKGTAGFLAKFLFAGFNVVILFGIIVVAVLF